MGPEDDLVQLGRVTSDSAESIYRGGLSRVPSPEFLNLDKGYSIWL